MPWPGSWACRPAHTWPVGRYPAHKGARSHVVEHLAAEVSEVKGLCQVVTVSSPASVSLPGCVGFPNAGRTVQHHSVWKWPGNILGLQNGIRVISFGDNTNIFTESGPEVLPALTELLLQYISVFILFTFSDKSQGIDRI